MTGIAGISLVGADPAAILNVIGSITVLGPLAKFSVSFPLVYHYFGALRHMYWDQTPETLEIVDVEHLSYVLLGTSVGLSAVLAIV